MLQALNIPLEEFLRPFFDPGETVCLRVFDDKKRGTFAGAKLECVAGKIGSMVDKLRRHNAKDRGVYFVVNYGGHEDVDITRVNAQFVECDDKTFEEQEAAIAAFPLPPSLIVRTQKSLHCYWLMRDAKLEQFRRVQKTLIAHFDGDPACVNESRVLRLPGFNHCKFEPVPVECVKFNPELRYAQEQLLAALPSVADAPAPAAAAPKGTRKGLSLVGKRCLFLQHCKDSAITLGEHDWYAMITNLAVFEGGDRAIHALSRGYPGYSRAETEGKIAHFLSSGTKPMTCAKIAEAGFKCPLLESGECGCKAPAALCYKALTVEELRAALHECPVAGTAMEDMTAAKQFVVDCLYNVEPTLAETFINYDLREHFRLKAVVMKPLVTEYRKAQKRHGESREIRRPAGEDWQSALQRNDKGMIANTIFNIRLVLENDPTLQGITYNMLADAMEFCGPAPWKRPNYNFWRDADDAQLESYLEENYFGFSQAKLKTAVTKVVDDRSYHPVREFLDVLPPWDGLPRVETLLVDTLGAEDSAYVRAVTRKVLCAAVMRVMRPGTKFDSMLVLNGPQGIGKSTLIARLGGAWFSDNISITDTTDKTAAEKLLGHWLLEFGELAGMRKADTEKLKAFISRQDDKYRAAYARAVTSHPRQCVFFGSTNSEHGFLRDVTGNRRFWPVKTPSVGAKPSWALSQDDVRQIWAEVLLFCDAGETLYLSNELNREAQAQQRAAMEADDREGMVRDFLETPLPENWADMDSVARREFLNPGNALAPAQGTLTRETVSNMEIWCECLNNRREALCPKDSHAICAMMERLGWQRTAELQAQRIYGRQRIYRRRE